ncbi:MAG: alpha/beta fold hydrolase [Verrucomicrobiota bacterium]
MVRAQRPLLRHLGLSRLHAVVGASMGGMLALAFAQIYPEMAERAIVIAAGPAQHAQAIAWNKIGRRAIMNDPLWREGLYYDSPHGPPKHGLAVARMIGHVTYISEGAMDRKFGRALQSAERESFSFGIDYSVESYLAYQGQVFHQRFDANSYLYITRAIDYFDFTAAAGGDLTAAFAATRARFLFLSYDADWLYSPERMEQMAQAAQDRRARGHAPQDPRAAGPRCLPRPARAAERDYIGIFELAAPTGARSAAPTGRY